jgi:predicted secreted hydrolase
MSCLSRCLICCLVWGCLILGASTSAQLSPVDEETLRDPQGFLQAGPGRPLQLPEDHGAHPDTRTEWWYLTGPLKGPGPEGELFGFQATWFRRAVVRDVPPGRSPLATRDVILFHGVLTDITRKHSRFAEQLSRAYPPWAHASTDRMDVGIFQQTLADETGAGHSARLDMTTEDARLELELDLTSIPPLLHGQEPGLSVKGHEPGQASWYYSLPGVTVRGTLHRAGEEPLPLTGSAWFDHEFGSSQLSANQQGWDWFSVVFDDDTQLMLYEMRLADGSRDDTSSGTLRLADGTRQVLSAGDFRIHVSEHWTSPGTGIRYPAGWTLEVPESELLLTVRPLLSDQELETSGTTGVTYWEGLCSFEGERAGRRIHGLGYVELVGYGDAIANRFQPAR